MEVLAAFDKCKDSLSAWEICSLVQKTLYSEFGVESTKIAPLTDGGEGFVEILTKAKGGTFHSVQAKDSLGKIKKVKIGIVSGEQLDSSMLDFMNLSASKKLAIVEMSSIVGLADLPVEKRDPWETSSFGVGELLWESSRLGADSILLGIGGSSTNDIGVGAMSALNIEFYDLQDQKIPFPAPKFWSEVKEISAANKLDLPFIRIACDVTNPLLGKNGATFQFGPQKGLRPESLSGMEEKISNMSERLSLILGKSLDLRNQPGTGAAGGIGYGLNLVYDAQFLAGFSLVEKWLELENRVRGSDLVITGEGRFDNTSLYGKGPYEIIRLASKHDKRVILMAGSVDEEALMKCKSEFSNVEIHAFGKKELSLQENLINAPKFVEEKVIEIFSEL